MTKRAIVVDSQILNTFQSCGMKTFLSFGLRLQTPSTPEAFEKGDLMHYGLEQYYKTKLAQGEEKFQENFDHIVEETVEAMNFKSQQPDFDIDIETCDAIIFQFREYVKHYRFDGLAPIEVEKPFIIQLGETDELEIYYSGKIDLYCHIPQWGNVNMDHKTTSRNSAPNKMSNQFIGYAYATGAPTTLVNKIGFQKTLKVNERFVRQPIVYEKELVEKWVANTMIWIQKYAEAIETGVWLENWTSCQGKFSGCVYTKICQSCSPEAREHIMRTDFVVGEKWDPTASLKNPEVKE